MTSQFLKQLISRRLRIPLLNTKVGMADVPGVKRFKNRQGLQWQEYAGQQDVPPVIANELSSLMRDFESKFSSEGARMIFAYYTKDDSIQQSHIQAINQSKDPRKQGFLDLITWLNKYGARLFMSPSSIERLQQSGQKVQSSSNTSNKWLEQFGYIWGLKKKGDYRYQRDALTVSDKDAEIASVDDDFKAKLESDGKYKLVKVVTAQKNGAWGIFYSDGYNLEHLIGDDYYNSAKTDENNKDWVDWDAFRQESGQHSKYFGFRGTQDGKEFTQIVYPTSSQFLLPNGEDDPHPVYVAARPTKIKHKTLGDLETEQEYIWAHDGVQDVIPANQIQQGENNMVIWQRPGVQPISIPSQQLSRKESPLYFLWIKNDGTLWWVPKETRNEVARKERKAVKKREGEQTGQPFPLTREQADFFNVFKDKHFKITKRDSMVYSWDTLSEETPEDKAAKQEKINDWIQKTNLMNQMYDFFDEHPQLPPMDVRLQAVKYCIVGPRFKAAENVGTQQAVGRMKSHHTHVEDFAPLTDEHIGTRKGWVVVGSEFNAEKAASRGIHGLNQSISIDGLGPITDYATVYEAINSAFRDWGINAPQPDARQLLEAQTAFDRAHGTLANPPKPIQAIPKLTEEESQQLGQPPKNPPPFDPTVPEIQPQTAPQPRPEPEFAKKPNIPVGTQNPVIEEQDEVFAGSTNVMNKTAQQLVNSAKRLGKIL